MRLHEATGLWIPDIMNGPGAYLRRAEETLHYVFKYVKGNMVALQAGGHIGIVPRGLAQHFRVVYTFEPEAANFNCLVRNLEDLPNAFAARGSLGERRGTVGLAVHSKGTGGHQVRGGGDYPTYRIDDLSLSSLNVLLLDLEGFEMHALRGAEATIKRCRPLMIVEENKKCHGQGFEFGDIEKLVAPWGYHCTARFGEDLVLERR